MAPAFQLFLCCVAGIMSSAARVMSRVLEYVSKQDRRSFFRVPVDPVACDAPGYFSVVKEPMDLGTIRTRVQQHYYGEDLRAFCRDVQLVFSNATLYNPSRHPVNEEALRLEAVFAARLAGELRRLTHTPDTTPEDVTAALTLLDMALGSDDSAAVGLLLMRR